MLSIWPKRKFYSYIGWQFTVSGLNVITPTFSLSDCSSSLHRWHPSPTLFIHSNLEATLVLQTVSSTVYKISQDFSGALLLQCLSFDTVLVSVWTKTMVEINLCIILIQSMFVHSRLRRVSKPRESLYNKSCEKRLCMRHHLAARSSAVTQTQ